MQAAVEGPPPAAGLRDHLLSACDREPLVAGIAVILGRMMRLTAGRLEKLYYAALLQDALAAMPPPRVDHRRWRHGEPGEHHYDPLVQLTEGVDCLLESRAILGYAEPAAKANGKSNAVANLAVESAEAKILAVADALARMAADEPRTHPLTMERARERLSAGSWRDLDAHVMKVAQSADARPVLDAYLEQAANMPAKQRDAVIAKAMRRLRRQLHAWTPPPEAPLPSGLTVWVQEHSWTLVASTAVLLITVIVFAGLIIAARRSLPGDPLYALKLTTEDVQLVYTGHDGELGLHEHFAGERVEEIQGLLDDGAGVPNSLLSALDHETLVLLQYLEEMHGDEQYDFALRLRDLSADALDTLERVQDRGRADEFSLQASIDTASLAALFAGATIGDHEAPADPVAAPTTAAPSANPTAAAPEAPAD
jgi:hypothetical protein